ncbi:MAG: hypothetical protein EOP38_19505, partial [Rubrivivax sp.]
MKTAFIFIYLFTSLNLLAETYYRPTPAIWSTGYEDFQSAEAYCQKRLSDVYRCDSGDWGCWPISIQAEIRNGSGGYTHSIALCSYPTITSKGVRIDAADKLYTPGVAAEGVRCSIGLIAEPNNPIISTTGVGAKSIHQIGTQCKSICPPGQKWVPSANDGSGACWPVLDIMEPDRSCKAGNPIYPLTGIKKEIVDLGINLGMFSANATYSSAKSPWGYDGVNGPYLASGSLGVQPGETPVWGNFGKLWWSNLHRQLIASPNSKNIQISRGDGQPQSFNLIDGIWRTSADVEDSLTFLSSTYRYRSSSDFLFEEYLLSGKLQKLTAASGMQLTPSYSSSSTSPATAPGAGYLLNLSDPFGRNITFTYKTLAGGDVVIASIVDAANHAIVANYNSGGNLSSLIWQDGAIRGFLYDSPHIGQEWALTGIKDELDKRYSTFQYNVSGWAESTQHAGGVDKFEVSYDTPPRRVIREELDFNAQIVRRHHEWQRPLETRLGQPHGQNVSLASTAVLGSPAQSDQGSLRNAGTSQPAGAGCLASSSKVEYSASTGLVILRDDFNAKRVCYAYGSSNRESGRIEGLIGGLNGTACSAALGVNSFAALPIEARKTSTEWHPDWKLETRRAEPKKLTTWVYNGQPDPFNG